VISKKVRELFVSLMEAAADAPVCYEVETEQYRGYFNSSVVDKYIELGALDLVDDGIEGDVESNGSICLLINNRDDFLSSFAAGIREAKNGSDQSYADYNANPFAFSVGYEHFYQLAKKKRPNHDYICHGVERADTGLIHQQ